MIRQKPQFDMTLLNHVKKYMTRSHQTFTPTDIVNDLMTLEEYAKASRPRLIKDVQRAYSFHQNKQNPIRKKRKTEIEDVGSEEDAFIIDADPDINPKKLMKYAVASKEKNYKRKKVKDDMEDTSDIEYQFNGRKIQDGSTADDQELRAKMLKRKFDLKEPVDSVCTLHLENSKKALLPVSFCLLKRNPGDQRTSVGTESWLLAGPPGSGKTSLIHKVGHYAAAQILTITPDMLISSGNNCGATVLKDAIELAKLSPPCIVHLDKLEDVLSQSHMTLPEAKLLWTIETELKKLRYSEHQVLVVGEVRSLEKLDSRISSWFRHETHMKHLDVDTRKKILQSICEKQFIEFDIDFDLVALRAHGFFGGDLNAAVMGAIELADEELFFKTKKETANNSEKKSSKLKQSDELQFEEFLRQKIEMPVVRTKHMIEAVKTVIPSLKEEFPNIPNITMDDIGGLVLVKQKIQDLVLDPIEYKEIFQALHTGLPHHILLWGPPGCGKTLLAQALANQAGLSFLTIKNSDILNKYQGESERAVRSVFEKAAKVPPCLVFFDEFDGICGRRSKTSDSGSKSSIVNSILSAMDGFNKNKDVYLLGATNRPHDLDPAVLRPGRFETIIHVTLPDCEARKSILEVTTKHSVKYLGEDVDFAELAVQTEGFSGADLNKLCTTAFRLAVHSDVQKAKSDLADFTINIAKQHFTEALKKCKPSITPKERKRYEKFQKKFGTIHNSTVNTTCDIFTEEDDENISSAPSSLMNMSLM